MAKKFIAIGATDLTSYVSKYDITYNVVYKGERTNAHGDLILDIRNRKVVLSASFRPTYEAEMSAILTAIEPRIVSVEYWNTKTMAQETKTMVVSSPNSDFYSNGNEVGMFNEFALTFKEL